MGRKRRETDILSLNFVSVSVIYVVINAILLKPYKTCKIIIFSHFNRREN